MKDHTRKALLVIFAVFSLLFIFKAAKTMATIPFHDYDEAHRAEGARNMRLNDYYVSPLTGTPYNKVNEHSQSYALNEDIKITPEASRPPLVFALMAHFSDWFGEAEWAYRLPSFLLALLGFAGLLFFLIKFDKDYSRLALAVAFLAFLTAYDWWHSGMMALLDTGVAAFTALAVFLLILFAKKQQLCYLIASGVSLGLGILSKGPPAVIFVAPFPYLLIAGKVKIKHLLVLFTTAFITILPWFIPLSLEHGWDYFFGKYIGNYVTSPQSTKLVKEVAKQNAPFYWYLRWWFDTLRPGIFLFGAFFLLDLLKKRLNWVKISLLFYIAGGFGLFSYAKAKVWWYVLPVVPAVCAYLYFASKDYLEENQGFLSLSLAIVVGSLPLFLWRSTTVTLAYGLVVTGLAFLLLYLNLFRNLKSLISNQAITASLLLSLIVFFFRFPTIKPPNPGVKTVAQYYRDLPGEKCLWIEEDFPYEAILFYSRAGRVNYLIGDTVMSPTCQDFLIGKQDHPGLEKELTIEGASLYKLD